MLIGDFMQTFIIIICIFCFILAFSINDYAKPLKKIVDKYGLPLNHFATQKAWNSLPIRGSRIDIDFYTDFLVITVEKAKEIVLKKDFKDYQIYGSFLNSVFEINDVQICLSNKQRKLLDDFFEN